ncbi:MAG: glycosyltransferase family 4 protein [Candidatus Saccharimonadales bacterium]
MKIGYVLDDTLDKPDGVQQYILTLGNWMQRQGHEVHYLVGESYRSDVTVHSLSKNIRVKFNKNNVSIPLPVDSKRIKALLTSEHFDVLHVQLPYSPMLGAKIIRLAPQSTAVVGTFHIFPYSKVVKVATHILGLYLRRNTKRFDAVMSVSTASQLFAKKHFHISSTVVPNAVDLETFTAPHDTNKTKLVILFLGRLVERKGCEHLLRSIALLPRGVKDNITVIIGGRGPLQKKLQKLTKKLHLNDIVEFVGYIDETKKAEFLAKSDISVFPSLGGESFGIIIVEAIAAGSSVVLAGNNPGYASILSTIPETLIDPLNHRFLAEKIELLLRDSALRSRYHEQQKQVIEQYNVSVVGKAVLDIYHDAIAKCRKTTDNHSI